MELNKEFSEFSGFTPYDYYCNPNNYRVSLNKISENNRIKIKIKINTLHMNVTKECI